MLAEQSLREGKLQDSLAQLQQQVRKEPANPKYRVFLFQLLAVLGQWDRALTQLNVAGELDAGTLAMVQTYREALRCEVLRAQIFAGRRSPMVFGRPEPWIALLIEALRLGAEGRDAESEQVRGEAFAAAPVTAGSITVAAAPEEPSEPTPFAWIADADPRLGPVLEAVINGRYSWVPFHRVRTIVVETPADLRDVVWTPVQLTLANGGQTVALIPTRYPGSEASADPLLRLARKTEWSEPAAGSPVGLGQRMLATDAGEYPLMDIRRIDLDSAADESVAAAGEAETRAGNG